MFPFGSHRNFHGLHFFFVIAKKQAKIICSLAWKTPATGARIVFILTNFPNLMSSYPISAAEGQTGSSTPVALGWAAERWGDQFSRTRKSSDPISGCGCGKYTFHQCKCLCSFVLTSKQSLGHFLSEQHLNSTYEEVRRQNFNLLA